MFRPHVPLLFRPHVPHKASMFSVTYLSMFRFRSGSVFRLRVFLFRCSTTLWVEQRNTRTPERSGLVFEFAGSLCFLLVAVDGRHPHLEGLSHLPLR
jgi:hypothetical protein